MEKTSHFLSVPPIPSQISDRSIAAVSDMYPRWPSNQPASQSTKLSSLPTVLTGVPTKVMEARNSVIVKPIQADTSSCTVKRAFGTANGAFMHWTGRLEIYVSRRLLLDVYLLINVLFESPIM
ncbi:hypothetical protein GcC1_035028 [Golovinomyces cichoracearum]|uniref:Uncharacterized protein n=1 Tax=Golovinomyces cichoracearum TaxID=62708 RepID=A0A420J132_9PEZI|nr:hypothetical protein GcC1_035028 [Golovinomyces cichoracearum]